jgi:transcription elongation factor GreA-like protein
MIQKLEKSLKNTNNETKRNEISKVISQAKEEQSKAEGTMKKYRDLIIQTFSILAKAEKEREGRKRRQKEYRDSKKIKARMNGIKV